MIVSFKIYLLSWKVVILTIGLYTDGSKAENRVAAAAISNNLSAQVRLPGNASIFKTELKALKLAFNIVKIVLGIILSYSLIHYLVFNCNL